MRIVGQYSHLNGYEHILIHKPQVWEEIVAVISGIDSEDDQTKKPKARNEVGRTPFSERALNRRFRAEFVKRNWAASSRLNRGTPDVQLGRQPVDMPAVQRRAELVAAGKTPITPYNQADLVKERIAVEIQVGKYSLVTFDLLARHIAFYVGDVIDVGVEILPMKEMTQEMSSGISYYEGELYNVIRQGRGVPAVPLVLLGIAP